MEEVFGQFRKVADSDRAMASMALPDAFGLEVRAERSLDHLTAHQFLDVVAGRLVLCASDGRTGRTVDILAVDPRHVAAKVRELFLDVLHASPFLCSG
jgi:hypothetical protein